MARLCAAYGQVMFLWTLKGSEAIKDGGSAVFGD